MLHQIDIGFLGWTRNTVSTAIKYRTGAPDNGFGYSWFCDSEIGGSIVRAVTGTQTLIRFVGRRLVAEIDPDRRVRQIEPLLQNIEPQHALDLDRWPGIAGLGIVVDQRAQRGPRHHPLHLGQKRGPPRRPRVALKPPPSPSSAANLCASTHPDAHYTASRTTFAEVP
jgi:hypothetical protein